MLEQSATIIGLIVNISLLILGLIQYLHSKNNSTQINNKVDNQQNNINQINVQKKQINNQFNITYTENIQMTQQQVKTQHNPDDSMYWLLVIGSAIIYYKYSSIVTLLLLITGLVSTLTIFFYTKKYFIDIKNIIPTYILFSLLFLATYFFKNPIYNADYFMNYSFGLAKLAFYCYQMGSAALIEGLFLKPIVNIFLTIFGKQSTFTPYSKWILVLGILSMLISTGFILKIFFSFAPN